MSYVWCLFVCITQQCEVLCITVWYSTVSNELFNRFPTLAPASPSDFPPEAPAAPQISYRRLRRPKIPYLERLRRPKISYLGRLRRPKISYLGRLRRPKFSYLGSNFPTNLADTPTHKKNYNPWACYGVRRAHTHRKPVYLCRGSKERRA